MSVPDSSKTDAKLRMSVEEDIDLSMDKTGASNNSTKLQGVVGAKPPKDTKVLWKKKICEKFKAAVAATLLTYLQLFLL